MSHDLEVDQAFRGMTEGLEAIEDADLRHRLVLLLATLEARVGEVETERDRYRQEAMQAEGRVEALVEAHNAREGRLEDFRRDYHDRLRHPGLAENCQRPVCDDIALWVRHHGGPVEIEAYP